jgi:hypothetical protein
MIVIVFMDVRMLHSPLLTFNPNKSIRGQPLYLSVTSQKKFVVRACRWQDRTYNMQLVEIPILEMGASH